MTHECERTGQSQRLRFTEFWKTFTTCVGHTVVLTAARSTFLYLVASVSVRYDATKIYGESYARGYALAR